VLAQVTARSLAQISDDEANARVLKLGLEHQLVLVTLGLALLALGGLLGAVGWTLSNRRKLA
jgi:hypothetical protein